eukprot:SAG11_NODE_4452_length_1889_cov_3.482123_1_plen_223_part_10
MRMRGRAATAHRCVPASRQSCGVSHRSSLDAVSIFAVALWQFRPEPLCCTRHALPFVLRRLATAMATATATVRTRHHLRRHTGGVWHGFGPPETQSAPPPHVADHTTGMTDSGSDARGKIEAGTEDVELMLSPELAERFVRTEKRRAERQRQRALSTGSQAAAAPQRTGRVRTVSSSARSPRWSTAASASSSRPAQVPQVEAQAERPTYGSADIKIRNMEVRS